MIPFFLAASAGMVSASVEVLSSSAALALTTSASSGVSVGIFMPPRCWTCGAALAALEAAPLADGVRRFGVCFDDESSSGRFAGPRCATPASRSDPIVARALSLASLHSRSTAVVVVFGASGAAAAALHPPLGETGEVAIASAAMIAAAATAHAALEGAAAALSPAGLAALAPTPIDADADAATPCAPLGVVNAVASTAELSALHEREDTDVVVLGLFLAATRAGGADALGVAAFAAAAKEHARPDEGWCTADAEEEEEEEESARAARFAFAVPRDEAALAELIAAYGGAARGGVLVLNAAANVVVVAEGVRALAPDAVTKAMATAAAFEALPEGELLRSHDPRRRNEHDIVLIAFIEGDGEGDARFAKQTKELRKSAKRFSRSVHHDWISSGGMSGRMYGQAATYFGLDAEALEGGTAIVMDYRGVPDDWKIPADPNALPTAPPMKYRMAGGEGERLTRKALRSMLNAVTKRFDEAGDDDRGAAALAVLKPYRFVKSQDPPAAANDEDDSKEEEEATEATETEGTEEVAKEKETAPQSNITTVVASTFGKHVLADDGGAVLLRLTGHWCQHCANGAVGDAMEELLAKVTTSADGTETGGDGEERLLGGVPLQVMTMDVAENDVPHPRVNIRNYDWRGSVPFILFAPGRKEQPISVAKGRAPSADDLIDALKEHLTKTS